MKSTHALCAQAIKAELKKAFPLIRFSVKSESYSGGSSVRVKWENGPTQGAVRSLTDKYQYGHFDGMIDYYEISNSRDDIPQAKYVFADRELSESTMLECFEHFKKTIPEFAGLSDMYEYSIAVAKFNVNRGCEYIFRFLCKMDLTKGVIYE